MAAARLRMYNVVVDCRDAVALSQFWAEALGWRTRSTDRGWATIGESGSSGPNMAFQPVPEPKSVKNRLHVDLLPHQGVSRTEERRRLESLGARLLRTVYQGGLVAHDIMADPEGNEFCLLEPYPDYFE